MNCPERIWNRNGWGSYVCDKPIKRNGKCGVHARADEQRVLRTEAASQQAKARNAQHAQLKEQVQALQSEGVACKLRYADDGYLIELSDPAHLLAFLKGH